MKLKDQLESVHKAIDKTGRYPISQEVYEMLVNDTGNHLYPYKKIGKWIARIQEPEEKKEACLIVFSTFFEVVKAEIKDDNDPDNDEVFLTLQFHYGNTTIRKTFTKEICSREGLHKLQKAGLIFNSMTDSAELLNWIMVSESKLRVSNIHTHLGWDTLNGGERVFKTHSRFRYNERTSESTYCGIFDMKPQGETKEWIDVVYEHVFPNVPLTVVMLSAFAAPLLPILTEKYDLGSIAFSLSGETSTGKSTAMMLATSVWGNPMLGSALMQSLNGTENALHNLAVSCNGMVIGLDDAVSAGSKFEWKSFLYNIITGVEKNRLTKSLNLRQNRRNSNFLLLSAEYSLIKSTDDQGLFARVFEIKDKMTTSRSQSDAIKEMTLANYGVMGEQYARFLVDMDSKEIQRLYKKVLMLMTKYFEPDELTGIGSRCVSKLAVILTAAVLFRKCFNLDLPMDGITEWLCNKVYEAMGKQDLTQLVLDMLMEYVHANGAHFAGMSGNTAPSVYGRVKKLGNGLEISILPGKFDEMLEDHGLLNKREAILRSLRSQRILRADQDRFDKRVVLAKNTNGVKCNQFIVPTDEYFQ